MNQVQMQTIAEALQTRRTWIVRGFEKFLDTWKTATAGLDLGDHDCIDLLEIETETPYGYTYHTYFVETGSNVLDMDRTDDGGRTNAEHYPDITPNLVKKIMANDPAKKIRDHFKMIQGEIDVLFEAEEKISDLIKKLS